MFACPQFGKFYKMQLCFGFFQYFVDLTSQIGAIHILYNTEGVGGWVSEMYDVCYMGLG